ncbi:MAG: thioredoxin family protein, partial [Dehalococcoidia bacterium]|nr:thioredoxin family protein [Dehalococcoidia bacterium]
ATLNLDIKVEEIKDMKQIMQYPILMTPGLVINGKVVMSGKVPTKAEIERYIMNTLDAEDKTE